MKMTGDTDSLVEADTVKEIIAELCVDAPSNDVRKVLQLYEYGKTAKQLEKTFQQCNKTLLEATLRYLQVYTKST